MSATIQEAIEKGTKDCNEYGLGFADIYTVRKEEYVTIGWDRYIYTPPGYCISPIYRYIGYVRSDGTAHVFSQ